MFGGACKAKGACTQCPKQGQQQPPRHVSNAVVASVSGEVWHNLVS